MKDKIEKQYFSPTSIANRLNCSQSLVRSVIIRFSIKVSTNSHGQMRITRENISEVCALIRLSQIFQYDYILENRLHENTHIVGLVLRQLDSDSGEILMGEIDIDSI
tara:strand:- start:2275 stop:2595 length:321 start_codon:yes stop_codon:yes gene_type:complete